MGNRMTSTKEEAQLIARIELASVAKVCCHVALEQLWELLVSHDVPII